MYKKVESTQIRRKKAEGNSKDGLFPTLNTDARKEAHITQAELAEKLGITTTTLVNYEKGRSPIKADLLIQYAKACNVSTDYLLGLSDCKSIENAQIQKKIGLTEDSIEMLKSHVILHDNAKIKVLDFILRKNHIKAIPPSFSKKGIKGANDLGLLNLIAHYLTVDNDNGVENLPCITSIVNNGSSMEIDSKYLTKGVLLSLITEKLVEYRQELVNKLSNKKELK